jgi:hypothetical protein
MFKKKEKVQTETIEAKDQETMKEEISSQDREMLNLIAAYKNKYDGVYDAADFMSVSQAFVEAEKLNINFAVYSEIVGLRKDIQCMTKAVEKIKLPKKDGD